MLKKSRKNSAPPQKNVFRRSSETFYDKKVQLMQLNLNWWISKKCFSFCICVRVRVCVRPVKMQPPGVPNVSSTANETSISWTAGSPVSVFFTTFDFKVEITQKNQTWKVSACAHAWTSCKTTATRIYFTLVILCYFVPMIYYYAHVAWKRPRVYSRAS